MTALLEVITSVGAGLIPKEAAKSLIAAAFPISEERVNAMIDPIKVVVATDAEKSAQQSSTEPAKAAEKPSTTE